MSRRTFITDEAVEKELEELKASPLCAVSKKGTEVKVQIPSAALHPEKP